MPVQIKGASAVVTGGGSGIGQALVMALAKAGAKVVVADIAKDRAESVAAAARAVGAEAVAAALDVTDASAVDQLVTDTVARWGRLDLMFNNAGIAHVGEVKDMSDTAWRRTIEINLWGVIHGVRAAYAQMIRQGAGHIVNTASAAGLVPSPGLTIYATTKHAVVGLSRSLRAEAALHGVGVSVVCPGFIRTRIFTDAAYDGVDGEALTADLERNRWLIGTPETVAADVLAGIARNAEIIVTPRSARAALAILRLLPSGAGLFASVLASKVREFKKAHD